MYDVNKLGFAVLTLAVIGTVMAPLSSIVLGGYDVWAQALPSDGMVKSFQKISDTEGDFGGELRDADRFGYSVASIGDLDGDGITDLAVGADWDRGGRGAVWILFMDTIGKVKSFQKISDTEGDFGGRLDSRDFFGTSVASIGDLDGDGITDLAVGAFRDDAGGLDRGAVWILFMDTNGKVKSFQKISDNQGRFGGVLDDDDLFGQSVAGIGDLNGDGIKDLAVGAFRDGDGGNRRGAIWILFMDTDGKVKSFQKISDTEGDFGGVLDNNDYFGTSLASIGDLDGDGITDLAVGAFRDDDGGTNRGAVWILFMNTDGTVKSEQRISDTQGDFGGVLDDDDLFGISVAGIGDLDGDGVTDLAVGSQDDDGADSRGAVWILFMDTNGKVKSFQKISDTEGDFDGVLDNDSYFGDEFFGASVASIGDLDGDGVTDLVVGARGDDDGGPQRGAVWILFMKWNSIEEIPGTLNCNLLTPTIVGTSDDDVIIGTPGDDIIHGLGGNDWIEGRGGNDVICGGDGDDEIFGELGDDTLLGQGGNDLIKGGEGNDVIRGDDEDDVLIGHDVIFGGPGNDELFGGDGNDWLYGNEGFDKLMGGPGGDRLDGSRHDRLDGSRHHFRDGETHDDVIDGDSVELIGGPGNDALYGGLGDDLLDGGPGEDNLYGRAGDDRLFGGDGGDYIAGGNGNDEIHGEAGDDSLYGDGFELLLSEPHDDRIFGGDGNDFIIASLGDDVVDGGEGDDRIWAGGGDDQVNGGPGNDKLVGHSGNNELDGGIGNDEVIGGYGNDFLIGGPGDDLVTGNLGDDTLWGQEGNDRLYGGDGMDIIRGDDGDDEAFGGEGNDRIFGGNGNDVLNGELGDDELFGLAGDDTLDGGPHVLGDSLYGGANDTATPGDTCTNGEGNFGCETIV